MSQRWVCILVCLLGGAGFFTACDSQSTTLAESGAALLLFPATPLDETGLASSCPSVSLPDDTFLADTVVAAPGHTGATYSDSALAVNGICGGGRTSGSLDVFSLAPVGEAAQLVLEWSGRRVLNGAGIDLVVFENAFEYDAAESETHVFIEAVVVEVGLDGENWCGFLPDYLHAPETEYSSQMEDWSNFAGKTPVLLNQDSFPLETAAIFDETAGGDGFDLDGLSADNTFDTGCSLALQTAIQSEGFLYLRLTAGTDRVNVDTAVAFPGRSDVPDSGPDIDGVVVRYVAER